MLAAVVLGVIYHYTGLRELSNGFYHLDVNRSIVEKLTAPFANAIPNINTMTWQKFRPIFYYFVDHDQSLKVQSDIIRFNGLLWTSIADLRVVAIIAIILFASSIVCSEFLPLPGFPAYRAAIPIVLLTIVFLLTFWFSNVATARHKTLDEEQCDYILEHHRDTLETKLRQLSDRLGRES